MQHSPQPHNNKHVHLYFYYFYFHYFSPFFTFLFTFYALFACANFLNVVFYFPTAADADNEATCKWANGASPRRSPLLSSLAALYFSTRSRSQLRFVASNILWQWQSTAAATFCCSRRKIYANIHYVQHVILSAPCSYSSTGCAVKMLWEPITFLICLKLMSLIFI